MGLNRNLKQSGVKVGKKERNKPPKQSITAKGTKNTVLKIGRNAVGSLGHNTTTFSSSHVHSLNTKESKRLRTLDKEREHKTRQERLRLFAVNPTRIRQHIIDNERIRLFNDLLDRVDIPRTKEHQELYNRECEISAYGVSWRAWNSAADMDQYDISIEDLEEIHAQQCIEEQMLTETDSTN